MVCNNQSAICIIQIIFEEVAGRRVGEMRLIAIKKRLYEVNFVYLYNLNQDFQDLKIFRIVKNRL